MFWFKLQTITKPIKIYKQKIVKTKYCIKAGFRTIDGILLDKHATLLCLL